jgi:hypothetical protein
MVIMPPSLGGPCAKASAALQHQRKSWRGCLPNRQDAAVPRTPFLADGS